MESVCLELQRTWTFKVSASICCSRQITHFTYAYLAYDAATYRVYSLYDTLVKTSLTHVNTMTHPLPRHQPLVPAPQLPPVDVDVSKNEGFGYVPKEKSLFLPLPSQAPTLYEDGAWLDAATTAKLGERLTLCLNEDRHSPLTLAAVYPFRCGTQEQMARQIREANRKDKSKNDDIASRKKVR